MFHIQASRNKQHGAEVDTTLKLNVLQGPWGSLNIRELRLLWSVHRGVKRQRSNLGDETTKRHISPQVSFMRSSRFVTDLGRLLKPLWSHYKTGEMKEWLTRSCSTGSPQREANCLTLIKKRPRKQMMKKSVTFGFILEKDAFSCLKMNRDPAGRRNWKCEIQNRI